MTLTNSQRQQRWRDSKKPLAAFTLDQIARFACTCTGASTIISKPAAC